jgi:hypothetical protein
VVALSPPSVEPFNGVIPMGCPRLASAMRISMLLISWLAQLTAVAWAADAPRHKTSVGIDGEKFTINGRPTYSGRTWHGKTIEGLLLNSRMVQAIFDDRNSDTVSRWTYPDTKKWDPDRNTREFVAAMPEWRQHGLLALTVNLQGGSPEGYSAAQPWHNSAFNADGTLRSDYLTRLATVLDKADELGMVVILGLFYFGQDGSLTNERAVESGVERAVDWLVEKDYRNVLLEIDNECDVKAYHHAILKADRVHELILLARRRAESKIFPLRVSTSYAGGAVPKPNVVKVSDFLLMHGNGVKDPNRIREMVREARHVDGYHPMPILFNEDDHYEFERSDNNFVAAIDGYASWGFFDYRRKGESFDEGYQSVPANWGISSLRKQGFFRLLSEITSAAP